MKFILLKFILWLWPFGLIYAQGLEVLSYNAYGPAYGGDLDERTTGLGSYLVLNPYSIVGLQEVWTQDHKLQLFEVMAQQKNKDPYEKVDFNTLVDGKVGLVSLFQGKELGRGAESYIQNSDGFLDFFRGLLDVKKAVAWVRLDVAGIGSLLFVNTHLHPTSMTVRMSQVKQLAQVIHRVRLAQDELIVVGDFNFAPDSEEYVALLEEVGVKDSYTVVHGQGSYKGVCSYCESNPYYWGGGNRVVDYVFYDFSKESGLMPVSTEFVLKEPVFSDHLGVRVLFKNRK